MTHPVFFNLSNTYNPYLLGDRQMKLIKINANIRYNKTIIQK